MENLDHMTFYNDILIHKANTEGMFLEALNILGFSSNLANFQGFL